MLVTRALEIDLLKTNRKSMASKEAGVCNTQCTTILNYSNILRQSSILLTEQISHYESIHTNVIHHLFMKLKTDSIQTKHILLDKNKIDLLNRIRLHTAQYYKLS